MKDESSAKEEILSLEKIWDYAEHNAILWVSYYSSHEAKTSSYLAKIKIPYIESNLCYRR